MEDAKVAIQEFGNVGYSAAKSLQGIGARIIAVSNSLGGVYNKDGLPIEALHHHAQTDRCLHNFSGGDEVTNEELLTLDRDILIPSAIENQVTGDNTNKLKCRIYTGAMSIGSISRMGTKTRVPRTYRPNKHFPNPIGIARTEWLYDFFILKSTYR